MNAVARELRTPTFCASEIFEYLDDSDTGETSGIGLIARNQAVRRENTSIWNSAIARRLRIIRLLARFYFRTLNPKVTVF